MPSSPGAEGDVGRWLGLLRDGSEAERQLARTELGLILESRGLLDDAFDAYARNVAEGVSDRRPYERLAALARARGDHATEAQALQALADVLARSTPAPSSAPAAPDLAETVAPVVPAASEASDLTAEPREPESVAPPDLPAPVDAPTDSPDPAATDGEPTEGDEPPDTAPATMASVSDPVAEPSSPGPIAEPAAADAEAASDEPPTTRLVVPSPAPDEPTAQASDARATATPSVSVDLAEPSPEPASIDATSESSPVTAERSPASPTSHESPTTPEVPASPGPSSSPASPESSALPDAAAPESVAPEPARPAHRRGRQREEAEDPAVALHHVLERHPAEAGRHADHHPAQKATAPAVAGMSRTLITLALLVPVLVVMVGAALSWQGTSGAGPLATPPSSPTATASRSPLATVEMRLIASTLSPLPSPRVAQTPLPTPTPTPVATPLAARCADAGLRFPETRDSEGAVRAAYREYLTRHGVVDAPSIEVSRLGEAYAARHEEVVAGWMAVTLQREQRGLPSFPLADYVASDVVVPTGPGEYQLRATISPQGWTEIRAWPADTCEGAFMRNPANGRWVDLMQASVGDITWALPTRPPPR